MAGRKYGGSTWRGVTRRKARKAAKRLARKQERRSNPVAKHCRTFNLATTQRDRKVASKRGYRKHRKAYE